MNTRVPRGGVNGPISPGVLVQITRPAVVQRRKYELRYFRRSGIGLIFPSPVARSYFSIERVGNHASDGVQS
jgi:hypothetical protein